MNTWVDTFEATTPNELTININKYCDKFNYEIISISVIQSGLKVYAFVVLKEGAN